MATSHVGAACAGVRWSARARILCSVPYEGMAPGRTIRARSGSRRARPRRRHTMPTVLAYHDVKDQKHWLASPKREEVFGPLGVTNIRTFIDPENPTRVG